MAVYCTCTVYSRLPVSSSPAGYAIGHAATAQPSQHAALIEAASLELVQLHAAGLPAVWEAAVREGVLTLPPRVPRRWEMLDGHTFVVEVRRGAEYQASVIACARPPEVDADGRVRRLNALLRAALRSPQWLPSR